MTLRDRRTIVLAAFLLSLGPASGLAQEQTPPRATDEAARPVVPVEPPAISWQPPKDAAAAAVRYRVRVLPVEGTDQLGPPVWEQAVAAPTVRYAGPPLDAQRSYVWTMEALDAQGRTIAADGGILGGGFSTGTLNKNFCIPVVFASASKICQGTAQTVTISGFLFTFQSGTTTYTLPGGNPPSGPWTGSVPLVPTPTTTTTYTLTLAQGTCQRTVPITVTVVPPPSLGPVTCSGAATQGGPFTPSSAGLCCGNGFGLQCQAAGPVVGNVQWTAGGSPVSGGTGAGVNVNPGALVCDPNMDKTIVVQATASTDPTVCPDVTSNPVPVTLYRPSQLGTIPVSAPVICADGVSTSTIGPPSPPVVGNVTWTHQPNCMPPPIPINPIFPLTVGPLSGPDCYTATATNGSCAPAVQNVRVDIDTPPVAGTLTAAPTPICPGNDSVLTLTGSSGNVQWYSSTTCTPGGVFASPMAGATGNTMQNTNNLSTTTCYGAGVSSLLGICPAVKSPIVPVTVQSLPVAPVVTGPSYICPGQTVTLNASAPGQWYHNGDPVGPPPFSEPGNYWETASNNCGTADSNILTVNPDLLTVKIQGPCCDCSGGTVQLCATAMNGTPLYHFAWSPGGINGSTGACIQVHPTATTTYTVTATDFHSCAVSTSFIVTVCP